jgi:hypothetical protein
MNEKSGLYSYVTYDYLVAGVKSDLGITDTDIHDLRIKDDINLGVKELKNMGTLIYNVTQLPIDNFRAKLPDGFVRFVKANPIVYVDEAGNAVYGTNEAGITVTNTNSDGGGSLGSYTTANPNFYPRLTAPVFINNAFFKDSPYGSGYTMIGTVNLVDGWLYFSSDVTAEYIKIAYLGANVNSDGDLQIPAYTERALRAFACFRWCRTHFNTHGAVLPSYEIEWKKAKAECRGWANMPDSLQYERINWSMLSLV